ncbi:MAG: hypothetical protein K9M49_06230 [Candidatus Marinimicrobia bacterium]|nr:hypothetical protein [Candidatus Neomarinimicrobiota bacterium]MCF7851474.1 hypothetical protein [Candidatus Neomarinimicrobiota bacterium]MCF7904733.1 hypothetical protein [Candidatus Neomarinimicrobiota bacterium]
MQIRKILIMLLGLVLLGSFSFAQSSSAMYKEAQKVFKKYRFEVDFADFQLKTYQEGGETVLQLLVIIKSGRNRFDEAMKIGFAASGAAIYKTDAEIDRVSVVVKIQYKDEESIAATADAADAIKLYKGEMNGGAFMARLTWY